MYGASERTIVRDLQELRNVGKTAGFTITERQGGDTVRLGEFKSQPSGILKGQKRFRSLVEEFFKAYGEPVHDLSEGLDERPEREQEPSFLHIVQPQLVEGSVVADVYRQLDAAWRNSARVEFRYNSALRTIEPAAAIVRSGRYYLIGRDVAKGADGWRYFAMDVIKGKIRRAGTFTRKEAPAKYLSTDAVGFIHSSGQAADGRCDVFQTACSIGRSAENGKRSKASARTATAPPSSRLPWTTSMK